MLIMAMTVWYLMIGGTIDQPFIKEGWQYKWENLKLMSGCPRIYSL